MTLRPEMEEADADLGYSKRYIALLHGYLEDGGVLNPEERQKVKAAHERLMKTYCSLMHRSTRSPNA